MTHDEVVKAMHSKLSEEIADAEKYCAMSECMESMGFHDTADGMDEMAYDEYTHAMFIHQTLQEEGVTIPDDLEKKFQALQDKMEDEFR